MLLFVAWGLVFSRQDDLGIRGAPGTWLACVRPPLCFLRLLEFIKEASIVPSEE